MTNQQVGLLEIFLKKKKKKNPATRPNNFLIGSSKRPKRPNNHKILTI